MKIYLITKNKGKLEAANSAFLNTNIKLSSTNKEYPEIQAESSLEIAKHSAIQAAMELQSPAIREDHSLFINALNGFPGPYAAYFERKIPAEKILELMKDSKDRTGYFEISAVLAYPDGKHKEFSYKVPIKISMKIMGTRDNWDQILMLESEEVTLAASPESDRIDVWNKNFVKIRDELNKM